MSFGTSEQKSRRDCTDVDIVMVENSPGLTVGTARLYGVDA
jgi:hypothetical protein